MKRSKSLCSTSMNPCWTILPCWKIDGIFTATVKRPINARFVRLKIMAKMSRWIPRSGLSIQMYLCFTKPTVRRNKSSSNNTFLGRGAYEYVHGTLSGSYGTHSLKALSYITYSVDPFCWATIFGKRGTENGDSGS